ncbi:MAG: hypothetical protein ACXWD3_04015 [Mycobacterium sp.]
MTPVLELADVTFRSCQEPTVVVATFSAIPTSCHTGQARPPAFALRTRSSHPI